MAYRTQKDRDAETPVALHVQKTRAKESSAKNPTRLLFVQQNVGNDAYSPA